MQSISKTFFQLAAVHPRTVGRHSLDTSIHRRNFARANCAARVLIDMFAPQKVSSPLHVYIPLHFHPFVKN
jgi:hypothetical protein